MSYLRHVHACNRYDPGHFRPLLLGSLRVGRLNAAAAAALERYPGVFRVQAEAVRIVGGDDPESVTAAIDAVVEDLVARGLVPKWRDELFAVTERWGAPALFELDRGAVGFFGTRSYGVHLNGVVRGADGGLKLWIGRRALDKRVDPGKLDNLVAGGIGAGYGLPGTLYKEAAEEADLPEGLARQAIPVGAITYRLESAGGLRDDVLFVYDLDLPAGLEPRNTDGEIADFRLLDTSECLRLVRETDEFKFNVNLVLIDFGIRHGLIGPDHPEYLDLVRGLRGIV